ncbi:hypothetical protein BRADI_1g64656v3 [Brachypodium distachyon]|uniref:Uncharacterized protein n=1 Tax=Brachypodium distachyon TaxID=15368 RepID=A0A2K2DTD9_BRADI|nr:hypothetical protein BRADI_1g64656v3 [Brachypodium distachyon]
MSASPARFTATACDNFIRPNPCSPSRSVVIACAAALIALVTVKIPHANPVYVQYTYWIDHAYIYGPYVYPIYPANIWTLCQSCPIIGAEILGMSISR